MVALSELGAPAGSNPQPPEPLPTYKRPQSVLVVVYTRQGEVLLLRVNLATVREKSPEAFSQHVAASPELLEPLDEELEAAREYLENRIAVIEQVASKAAELNHQGHTASACVHDGESSNWLYDAVHEALIDQFEFDESDVARDLKGVDQILGPLEAKAKTGSGR